MSGSWPAARMRLRSLPSLFSLSSVLLLAACGPGAPPAAGPPAPGAAEAAPATIDAGIAAEPGDASVAVAKDPASTDARPAVVESPLPTTRVLDAGGAPRRKLRYAFTLAPEWMEMDLKMSMAMGMGGNPGTPVHIPTVRTWTRIKPKELTPEGDLRCGFVSERVQVLDDVKIAPAMRANLEKEMGGLIGLEGTSKISPRGVATEVEFSLPATASDAVKKSMESMRDAIRQMYVPLPEEEVGVGARWLVTSRMPLSGAVVDMNITYALKQLRPDGMRADVEIAMAAPSKQVIKMATLPPGATAMLDSLSGHGSGKVAPTFARLVGEGTTHIELESAFEISAKGEHVRMVVNAETNVAARPSKGPPAKTK